ncbi:hypothetical protein [Paenibacillus puerhi]|uniref:hypothetical protein n=1 Tax=Paenibacillus puerhi TaxID=2692622 RepID=UPI001357A94E|nr:hypothetical protein [Paenibacillus puerhi]
MTIKLLFMVFVLLVSGLLIYFKKKTIAFEKKELSKLAIEMKFDSNQQMIVLFLNYQDINYGVLNELLDKNTDPFYSMIIVMKGPQWLTTMKKKTWNRHRVIDLSEYPWIMPRSHSQVTSYINNKVVNIYEPVSYIKNMKSKSLEQQRDTGFQKSKTI